MSFFNRPYKEYGKWLQDNTREQLDFAVMDLIRLSASQKIICDLHLTLDEAAKITDHSHIVFLIKNPERINDDYCNRPDHQDFNIYINSSTNPEETKENYNKTLNYINKEKYDAVKNSSYFWIERDSNSNVQNTLSQVEKHFGFI